MSKTVKLKYTRFVQRTPNGNTVKYETAVNTIQGGIYCYISGIYMLLFRVLLLLVL